jgi:hypothetical protein
MALALSALTLGPTAAADRAACWQALALLRQAHIYALELERDPWNFALEIDYLHKVGISNTVLRWLVCQGYVRHAAETTRAGKEERSFRPTGRLSFTEHTCFICTELGLAISTPEMPAAAPDVEVAKPPVSPHWDKGARELRWGTYLIKQFRTPATNQELILAALQEEGWPSHIDDPLPPLRAIDSRKRLHDAINRLNRKQKHALVRFRGDGTGRGLYWEGLWDRHQIVTRSPPARR